MDPGSSILLILFVVFILLTAFVAAAEAVLASINRARLRVLLERGVSRARAIQSIVEAPHRSLTALVILDNLGLAAAAAVGALWLAQLTAGWALAVDIALLALVVFLATEIIPKAIAARWPEAVAAFVAGPVDLLATILSPLIGLLIALRATVPATTDEAEEESSVVMTEEELRLLVDAPGAERIDQDEKKMIAGIFELSEMVAREVMVPRIDIVALDVETPAHRAIDLFVECGHSRLPVYEDSIDNIIGVLYIKDLVKFFRDGQLDRPVREMLRPAHFIPETKRVDELLADLQASKVHIAIVVDEYGGTAGLVTIEDLLEEIVGEIQDEYDLEGPSMERINDHEVIFDARVDIDDVNRLLGLDLPSEETDTLGGLIYSQLGKVPVAGDEVRLDGVSLTVLSVARRRIERVKVSRVSPPSGRAVENAEVRQET